MNTLESFIVMQHVLGESILENNALKFSLRSIDLFYTANKGFRQSLKPNQMRGKNQSPTRQSKRYAKNPHFFRLAAVTGI